ncbi:MAG: cache domain-containing protein [Methanosarcina sp.]|uniref:cache domain-containing protein n=1 Tax=Methanosarcina sp. TaxID=2213 RepID=UPI0026102B97|nr:cache domain-containing protein [Methanosarcina sp.]MDD3247215.1 cache domain-containing protein [Methanosarcina sp.]
MNHFKNVLCVLFITVLLLAVSGCVQSEKTGVIEPKEQTSEEKQTELLAQKDYTMSQVNAAIDLINEKGELAFPDFREKDSKWFHNDSYITVWKTEGIRVVFPPKTSGEGENVSELKDYNGKPLGRMLIDTALSEKGEGWVNYDWPKPGETEPSKKCTFTRRTSIGNQTYLVHSGFYVDDYIYNKNIEDIEDINYFGNAPVRNLINPNRVEMELDINYSIAHFLVKPGDLLDSLIMKNPETYYVLEGEGMLYIEDVPFELKKGQIVLVPANAKQSIENTGNVDLEFLSINQPAWEPANEVILE